MLDKTNNKLSLKRQCQLVGLPRSTAYYRAVDRQENDLEIMNCIDEIYTNYPFYGQRRMCFVLQSMGFNVNRKRVRRLMHKMGIQALYPKRNLSHRNKQHNVYPYLLRSLSITQPNQVWCSDITYIRLDRGYIYLVAIMDWYSRKVLAWELSNTLSVDFCLQALRRALHEYGAPSIFNTDQGVQFTCSAWIEELKSHGCNISMDGRGRALDNVFIERLWRTLKYEEVYLHEYSGVSDARKYIKDYFVFYNQMRPHSSLGYKTPSEVYHEVEVAA